MTVYYVPDDVHHELLNWSRWCWLGEWPHPIPATSCGSLEAQYRAPPDWNPDDVPPVPYIRPNERHAKIVQAVYDQLPELERQILRAEYPGRMETDRPDWRHAIAVRLGIPMRIYNRHFKSAVNKVEAAFEIRA